MPQVLWSEWATDDFVRIIGFIQIDNPIAAERLRKTIEKSAMQLVYMSEVFKPGRVHGTRELVIRPNYIMVYQTDFQQTVILRILHARQTYL
jgi:addiction module RelE/StbE family toxin